MRYRRDVHGKGGLCCEFGGFPTIISRSQELVGHVVVHGSELLLRAEVQPHPILPKPFSDLEVRQVEIGHKGAKI